MDKPIELRQGETYIFQKRIGRGEVHKIKILEITNTSIYIENLDINHKYRYNFHKFNQEYKPIEALPNRLLESLIK